MSTSKEAETAHCPRCGADTTRTPDGECIVCRARAAGEAERAAREANRQAERERLGLAPLARSIMHGSYALEAGEARIRMALRYAEGSKAVRLERALHLVREARRALL